MAESTGEPAEVTGGAEAVGRVVSSFISGGSVYGCTRTVGLRQIDG